jgi:hypothetical protein
MLNDLISEVKEQIQAREAIPAQQQSLYRGATELRDRRIVRDYWPGDNCTLHLVERIPSMEVRIMQGGTTWSVQVRPTDALSAIDPSLPWEHRFRMGLHPYLGGEILDHTRTFESYSIRNGMLLHLDTGGPPWISGIWIKGTGGRIHILRVSSTDLVFDLKLLIQDELEEIAADRQLLIFEGRLLEDERTLGDYHVEPDATIYVAGRLRG